MKTSTNKNASTETVITNPFDQLTAVTTGTSQTRRLDFTPALQDLAHQRAVDLCKQATTADLAEKANRMMDTGAAEDLLDLIYAVYDDETIKSDASVLDGCDESDLPKMLESQRSNRSKSKHAGLRVKLTNTVAYIAAMYAELLIRQKTGKPYSGNQSKIAMDIDSLKADPDLLKRKINSLASKKSRLTKLAEYDPAAKAELDEVESQLAELRGLRPTPTKTAVKSVSVSELKKALAQLADRDDLPADVLEMMKKLG